MCDVQKLFELRRAAILRYLSLCDVYTESIEISVLVRLLSRSIYYDTPFSV